MLYGKGISKEGSVLDMALQANVVKKSGSWFTYEGDQLGQGRENVRQFLKDNPELTEEIENKVKAAFGLMKHRPVRRGRWGGGRRGHAG